MQSDIDILRKLDSIEKGTVYVPETNLIDGNGKPIVPDTIRTELTYEEHQKYVDTMGSYLNVIKENLFDENESVLSESQYSYNDPSDMYYEDLSGLDSYTDEYDSEGNYIPPVQAIPVPVDYGTHISNQAQIPQINSTEMWVIEEIPDSTVKSIIEYKIKNTKSNQVILDNIYMKEAALSLLNILKEGHSLSDPKVLGIISSGIEYGNVLNEGAKHIRERKRVLNESNYSRAQELDVLIEESKKQAKVLQSKVLKFLSASGFI